MSNEGLFWTVLSLILLTEVGRFFIFDIPVIYCLAFSLLMFVKFCLFFEFSLVGPRDKRSNVSFQTFKNYSFLMVLFLGVVA